jgi:hypothetical protein
VWKAAVIFALDPVTLSRNGELVEATVRPSPARYAATEARSAALGAYCASNCPADRNWWYWLLPSV